MKKISMMQAAGEAGQCIVGFAVAAMLFYALAGAMVFLFVALAVVAPVLILLNAYADGMIFQERGGGDEDDLENDSKTVLADSSADSDSGDSKNDDSDSAKMSADSERPSSEEKP